MAYDPFAYVRNQQAIQAQNAAIRQQGLSALTQGIGKLGQAAGNIAGNYIGQRKGIEQLAAQYQPEIQQQSAQAQAALDRLYAPTAIDTGVSDPMTGEVITEDVIPAYELGSDIVDPIQQKANAMELLASGDVRMRDRRQAGVGLPELSGTVNRIAMDKMTADKAMAELAKQKGIELKDLDAIESKARKEVSANTKLANAVINQADTLKAGYYDESTGTFQLDDAMGAADLAAVFAFMKSLDPASTVRDSEFAAASGLGNLWTQATNLFEKNFNSDTGEFLQAGQREQFLELAQRYANMALGQREAVHSWVKDTYVPTQQSRGIPISYDMIVTERGESGLPEFKGGQSRPDSFQSLLKKQPQKVRDQLSAIKSEYGDYTNEQRAKVRAYLDSLGLPIPDWAK